MHSKYSYHPWNFTYCIVGNAEYSFCRQTWKEIAKKAYRPAHHHHNCQDVDKKGSHISSFLSAIQNADEETKVTASSSASTVSETKQKEQFYIAYPMTTVPLVINVRIHLNQGDYLPLEFMAWLSVNLGGFFPIPLYYNSNLLIVWLTNY